MARKWRIMLIFVVLALARQAGGEVASAPLPLAGIQVGQVLSSQDLSGILVDHLSRILRDPRKRVEVRDFRIFDRISLPKERLSCQVGLPDQAARGGNLSGFMSFLMDGQEWKKIRFSARADIYADVWVARRHLKKHLEIQPEDLQVENRNIANLPPDVLTPDQEVRGKRTLLAINAGEVLRESMLEVPPMVKKGDRVILLIENDSFRITTLGEVKENGRKGDRVKLINLSSKREVLGRVIDSHTVQVEY